VIRQKGFTSIIQLGGVLQQVNLQFLPVNERQNVSSGNRFRYG
jgi:hypothetical protein